MLNKITKFRFHRTRGLYWKSQWNRQAAPNNQASSAGPPQITLMKQCEPQHLRLQLAIIAPNTCHNGLYD